MGHMPKQMHHFAHYRECLDTRRGSVRSESAMTRAAILSPLLSFSDENAAAMQKGVSEASTHSVSSTPPPLMTAALLLLLSGVPRGLPI